MRYSSQVGAALLLLLGLSAPSVASAQEPATITGRVTNLQGEPELGVELRIAELNSGTRTGGDGTYRLVLPGTRIRAGQAVALTASRPGLASSSRSISLSPGVNLTQNFQLGPEILALDSVVVTGAGGSPTARSRGAASIPASYIGRWAPNARACRNRSPTTQVVEIDAQGWRSFEEGGRVTGRSGAGRGVDYFNVETFSGAEEQPGSLALRRVGARLAMSETVAGRTRHRMLVRCR